MQTTITKPHNDIAWFTKYWAQRIRIAYWLPDDKLDDFLICKWQKLLVDKWEEFLIGS